MLLSISNLDLLRKLPLCYLVDSVLKNIGEPYVTLFGSGVRINHWILYPQTCSCIQIFFIFPSSSYHAIHPV